MPLSETKKLGFTKLTIEAFYRVTGKSHQAIGVIPDIMLPSLYDNFKSSEKDKPYALLNDSTTVTLKHKALPELKLKTLIETSNTRIDSTQEFTTLKTANTKLYNLLFKEGNPYPLTLKAIATKKNERRATIDSIFDTNKNIKSVALTITNTKSTQELLQYNTEDKTQNDNEIKNIATDAYIKEAQYILTDYINSNQ
jgi:carboxyl-terminal processing protease